MSNPTSRRRFRRPRGLGQLTAGVVAGVALAAVLGVAVSHHGGTVSRTADDLPTPTASPSPSPDSSPSPSPEASSSPGPSATPIPTVAPTPVPTPPTPTIVTPPPAPPPGKCTIVAYTEVDMVNGAVDLLVVPEGESHFPPPNGPVMGGCPVRRTIYTITITAGGIPVTGITGDPLIYTAPICSPTTCMTVSLGQGAVAAHTGVQPFVWTNWCGAKEAFAITVRLDVDGVIATATQPVSSPPACASAQGRSKLTPPSY
ncbi:MAG TPA: hypothetical protein VH134_03920 [Candidatus Dormibacteraeota bacterium]|nr:hypothetical protein [Candidatus Dormibacteraeota bacterium]